MPYAIDQGQCPPLFRRSGQRNADHFPARIRGRPHQLGAADALLLARPPLHRLFRARLHAVGRAADGDVYTYKHFYTDALAVLDHLKIENAHLVGLSMGAYSSLQIGLNAPQRALSMTLAGVGSGSSLENLDALRKQCRANAEQFETIGSVEVAKVTREAPSRIPFLVKDPRGHADFYAALARHDAKGSANTMRGFQGGRPSIYTMTDAIRKRTDAGADHLRRRGRSIASSPACS